MPHVHMVRHARGWVCVFWAMHMNAFAAMYVRMYIRSMYYILKVLLQMQLEVRMHVQHVSGSAVFYTNFNTFIE